MGFLKKRKHEDIRDFRPESEKSAEKDARKPLRDPQLETCANELVQIYGHVGEEKAISAMRPMGEAINDNEKMVLVAYRAKFLAQAYGSPFSIRILEYAWDGIAGWMK